MICLNCNKEHDGSFGSGKFCSKSCSCKRVWSEEDKLKISNSVKTSVKAKVANTKRKGVKKVVWDEKKCPICGKIFSFNSNRPKKTCSRSCSYKIPGTGGYRNGSGRAKSGYYKGIYCGSTYELVWVIYQLDNNKEFSRFETTLEYNGKKYIPDFLQNGMIIEIKGYEKQELVDIKTEVANKNGYQVLVKRKKDLTDEFDWVKNNYEYKYVQELYDNFKPKYEYVCASCGETFNTEKKRKKDIHFCSRKCSGVYVNKTYCTNKKDALVD